MLSVKPSGVGEEVLSIFFFFFSCVRASVQLLIQSDSSLHRLRLIPVTAAQIQSRHTEAETKEERGKSARIVGDRRNIFQHTGCDWIIPLGFKPKDVQTYTLNRFRTVNFGTSIESLLYTWPPFHLLLYILPPRDLLH